MTWAELQPVCCCGGRRGSDLVRGVDLLSLSVRGAEQGLAKAAATGQEAPGIVETVWVGAAA
jgi:hypothetical protein